MAPGRQPEPPWKVPDMAQITCRYCGVTVETNRPSRIRCESDDCRRQYQRDAMAKSRAKHPVMRPERSCRECGVSFSATSSNSQFCSPEHARAAHLKRRRDNEYQPPIRSCDFCGGQIPYKSGKKRYCSDRCQKDGIAREAKWRVKGLDPSTVLPKACQICGATDRRLVIDHDHDCCPGERTCGKCFRGMLCHPHNVALGMFQEDPAMLRKAARYIENAKRDQQFGQLRLVI